MAEVIIVWGKGSDDDGSVYFGILAWDGGAGPPRVYEKGKYDSRCDLGRDSPLPYVRSAREAYAFALANENEHFQLDVRAAAAMGLFS